MVRSSYIKSKLYNLEAIILNLYLRNVARQVSAQKTTPFLFASWYFFRSVSKTFYI